MHHLSHNLKSYAKHGVTLSKGAFSGSRTLHTLSKLDHYLFPATARKVGTVWSLYTTDQIHKEPALFSADLPYALQNGGLITHKILNELMKIPSVQNAASGDLPGHHVIIDTRIHELQMGEYPAIPGWHTDFVERSASTNMQPDYRLITPSVKTYIVNISDHAGGVSNTEYLQDAISLNIPTENVYMNLDEQIRGKLSVRKAKVTDGDILQMDQLSLHRATPAHSAGMRYFLRLGILHNLSTTILQKSPPNELRRHSHFYLSTDQAPNEKPPTKSHSQIIGNLSPVYSVKEIKKEPILIEASLPFSFANGGPITRECLFYLESHLQGIEDTITVNTRVHMLMKGQNPDISSWRSSAPFEENIPPINRNGEHFVMYFSNKLEGVSSIEMELDGKPHVLKDGDIMQFADGAINRSLKAHLSGWRLTIIVSVNKNKAHQNKIATQLPVYLENINLGW
jgi:hypothetical protein